MANALSQSPCLDSWLAQFLEGEENKEVVQSAERGDGGPWADRSLQLRAGAKAKRLQLNLPADSAKIQGWPSAPAAAMPEVAPDPILQHTRWVDWQVKQMQGPQA